MLIKGNAIINPASTGFLIEIQLAKAIIKPEIITFREKININESLSKKIFDF